MNADLFEQRGTFDDMPWYLKRFVRSICAPFAYDPAPAIVPDDEGNEQ